MTSDLSGKYEVVVPVATEKGTVPAGETVELSHADAETFLVRGLVRKSDTPESGAVSETHQEGGGDDELSVTPNAGREALLEAGYATDEEVRAASDEDLLALDGISQGRLAKIRELVAVE